MSSGPGKIQRDVLAKLVKRPTESATARELGRDWRDGPRSTLLTRALRNLADRGLVVARYERRPNCTALVGVALTPAGRAYARRLLRQERAA